MKKFCPKILHSKPYSLSPDFGFTLIELLVVVAIAILLTGGGIAAYNNFNQNQILSQAATTLRTTLRDAQSQALSGKKDCSASACGGPDGQCDNVGDLPLAGWQVTFTTPRAYTLAGVCGPTPTIFSEVPYSLPAQLQFSTLPSSPILFKAVAQGTNIDSSTTITLSLVDDLTKTKTVTVYASGEIR